MPLRELNFDKHNISWSMLVRLRRERSQADVLDGFGKTAGIPEGIF